MSLEIECKRIFLEKAASSLLGVSAVLQECQKQFNYIQLVDHYNNNPNFSHYIIAVLIIITTPIFFTFSAYTAERFLALEMKKMSTLLKMSQSLSAVTLLAFAGCAPDIIASLSNSRNDEASVIVVSIATGVYIFGITMIMGVLSYFSKSGVKLPKYPILKEILFSFLLVIGICITGFIGSINYVFIGMIAIYYILYILTSLYIDKFDTERIRSSTMITMSQIKALQNVVKVEEENKKQEKTKEIIAKEQTLNQSLSNDEEITNQDIKMDGLGEIEKTYPDHVRHTMKILNDDYNKSDEEKSNFIFVPLKICQYLTVPFEGNRVFKGNCILIPMFCGLFMAKTAFEIGKDHFLIGVAVCAGLTLIYAILMNTLPKSRITKLFRSIVIVLVALTWIQLFIAVVIDYITFISFYFSVNEVILKSFLLSSGNSIGELFGSRALALNGAEVMATVSTYSGAFTNMIVIMFFTAIYGLKNGSMPFDIFGIVKYSSLSALDLQGYYVLGFVVLTLLLLLVHFVYFSLSGFMLTKGFGISMICVYSIVFVVSIVLGLQ